LLLRNCLLHTAQMPAVHRNADVRFVQCWNGAGPTPSGVGSDLQ
jgi:hypothetical protein